MTNQLQKGKLKRWNEEKGFGFISTGNGGRDVFIHISALKRMGRRPIVGDVIIYQIHTDNVRKTRAVNAKIEGVEEVKPRPARKNIRKKNNSNWFSKVLSIALVIILGSFVYNKFVAQNEPQKQSVTSISSYEVKEENKEKYSCAGKVYCSEMTSCEEATYYQNYCPSTKMDGDGDGIPCESQWCSGD